MIIPGGREKGKHVQEASFETLSWWAENGKEPELREACAAEIARRGGGGGGGYVETPQSHRPAPAQAQRPRQSPSSAAALVPSGILHDPSSIASALSKIKEVGHLISPITITAAPPEGVGVAFNVVGVDVETETYGIPHSNSDTRGIGKSALDKIGRAAGLCWIPRGCRRLDDGSDPHYVHYRAEAFVFDLDGTVKPYTGEVEIDMREGSPQVEEIRRKASNKGRDDPMKQIIEIRKFLIRHAESKAKLRVIRSLSIRTSYSRAELEKPFIVVRAVFTGESSDPEIRRRNADRIADRFLGAADMLFGAPSPAPRALPMPRYTPPRQIVEAPHEPPPVGALDGPDDDFGGNDDGDF